MERGSEDSKKQSLQFVEISTLEQYSVLDIFASRNLLKWHGTEAGGDGLLV
jgi:hypothetical protein